MVVVVAGAVVGGCGVVLVVSVVAVVAAVAAGGDGGEGVEWLVGDGSYAFLEKAPVVASLEHECNP